MEKSNVNERETDSEIGASKPSPPRRKVIDVDFMKNNKNRHMAYFPLHQHQIILLDIFRIKLHLLDRVTKTTKSICFKRTHTNTQTFATKSICTYGPKF